MMSRRTGIGQMETDGEVEVMTSEVKRRSGNHHQVLTATPSKTDKPLNQQAPPPKGQ
jgi:hypothetical protein